VSGLIVNLRKNIIAMIRVNVPASTHCGPNTNLNNVGPNANIIRNGIIDNNASVKKVFLKVPRQFPVE